MLIWVTSKKKLYILNILKEMHMEIMCQRDSIYTQTNPTELHHRSMKTNMARTCPCNETQCRDHRPTNTSLTKTPSTLVLNQKPMGLIFRPSAEIDVAPFMCCAIYLLYTLTLGYNLTSLQNSSYHASVFLLDNHYIHTIRMHALPRKSLHEYLTLTFGKVKGDITFICSNRVMFLTVGQNI